MPSLISIIQGPNINMLGWRPTAVYGALTMPQIHQLIAVEAERLGVAVDFFQSNSEGDLVTHIQNCKDKAQAILLNAGAFTHYSIALRDAIEAAGLPVVELHLSNIYQRESIRHRSIIAPVCTGQVCGLGKNSYIAGLRAIVSHLNICPNSDVAPIAQLTPSHPAPKYLIMATADCLAQHETHLHRQAEEIAASLKCHAISNKNDLLNCLDDNLKNYQGVAVDSDISCLADKNTLHTLFSAISLPCIEVFIQQVATSESFHHPSALSAVCVGVVGGFGVSGFSIALQSIDLLRRDK